jgi:hypothetical protein
LTVDQGLITTITTTYDGTTPANHDYATGLIVRFYFPDGTGLRWLDEQTSPITVINDTQFTVPIDTTNMDAFNINGNTTPAQVTPAGEIASIFTMATKNVLPYP